MKKIIFALALLLIGVGLQAQSEKKVEVSVQEENGLKKVTIKKHLEDGSLDIINWEGEGDIPEDILKQMKENGKMMFIHQDGKIELLGGKAVKTKTIKVKVNGKDGDVEADDVNIFILKDGEEHTISDKGVEVLIKKDTDSEKEIEVIVVGDEEAELHTTQMHKSVVIIREVEATNEEQVISTMRVLGEPDEEKVEALEKMERSLELNDYQLAPNPASERFNLTFQGEKAPITVRAFNTSGQEVYKSYLRDFDGYFNDFIELEGIQSNMLFITIEQNGRIYTDKVMLK
ncbi:MAG: T9SS type A sorting domain-containing protein [Bacteroidota bacterium]